MPDVIVVGAGPAGSAAACHLARAGLDVRLLEKSAFPREKVCGDGLTPRAVRELLDLGIDIDAPGWFRNRGLRLIAGDRLLELPWPSDGGHPPFGLTRTRHDFDDILARHAVSAGATLSQNTKVTGPLQDRTGRVIGVRTDDGDHRAPIVIAADGASSRLSVALGLHPRRDRPIGVAARRYYRSPRHDDPYLEAWLDLVPAGYGWVFGMGDGTCNVGVAFLRTAHADCPTLLDDWLARTPPDWGFTEDNAAGPLRGAALPMGYARRPHYYPGLLLTGDSGGMINPSNGEGIAYALEAARIAAETITSALAAPTPGQRERTLYRYPSAITQANGRPFTLGRLFTRAIENPHVMRAATAAGIANPPLMRFALKLLGNLTDPTADRLATALTRLTPTS
ncbi:geranylgeranyl reductase family protein [Actinomadura opuntiae]|uniref:geranylgeranyl reductase family protein n=1 Tax=Actinomadura sp. OS1-43 TaxID=604315 RepID=UPI00255B2687|nr:geranylgeranyl reductase family protein [Actinomadura sp. OS1-43]MDL4815966.1 geranylgeranyl reductase family protein [Actinomadura sp. OS1-43]